MDTAELERGIRGVKSAIIILRETAERVGPLHSYWDTIFDLEQLLKSVMDTTSRS